MFVRTTAIIPSVRLEAHFADLADPRAGAVTDPLLNLVVSAIGAALSHTQRDGKEREEVRSDIRSRYVSAQRFAETVRSRWNIKNRLRRTALGLLKPETMLRARIKNKRLNAGWDAACLQKVRCGS